MSVELGSLQAEQADAKELLNDLGLVGQPLEPHELVRFGRSFERQFVSGLVDRETAEIMRRHRGEILLGAMVAKRQMEAQIDGQQPASGKIGGPLWMRACWFGIGDDWEDIDGIYSSAQTSWTTGTPQDWIHSGTLLLAGTDGNAIRILENAVHVIIGIGSLHTSPIIETVKFVIDGKEKSVFTVMRPQKIGASVHSRKIHEFDNGIILKKDSTFQADVFISRAIGAPSTLQQDYPWLVGASFIREDALRLHDPATLPGTAFNIVTTS